MIAWKEKVSNPLSLSVHIYVKLVADVVCNFSNRDTFALSVLLSILLMLVLILDSIV